MNVMRVLGAMVFDILYTTVIVVVASLIANVVLWGLFPVFV
jgi:hypothetical protein